MRKVIPTKRSYDRHAPYGGRLGRAEHRVLRVGHGVRPEYTRKLIRMITRVFR